MNPASARALGQMAIGLFLIALLVPAPPLRLGLLVLAALCAVGPAMAARGWWRLGGLVLMILSLVSALLVYPAARKALRDYRSRQASAQPWGQTR